MKKYELIQELEKKIRITKEQRSFLKNQLETYDKAIKIRKETLEEAITEYNIRAQKDQEILVLHDKNIKAYQEKLSKLLEKEIKEVKAPKEIKVEKTNEQKVEEELLSRQKQLEADMKEFKEKVPRKIKIQKDVDIIYEDATKQITKQTPSNEVILSEKKDISAEMKKMTTEMNGEIEELERLFANKKLQDKYAAEEGGKAIHQGRVTNGFRRWCEERGYTF